MNPHCRIGRVRLKAHPEVRVIVGSRADNPLHDTLRQHVATLIECHPDMQGYAVVVWDRDGHWDRASRTTAESPVGQTMLPSFAADALRRDTMKDVVEERLGLPKR